MNTDYEMLIPKEKFLLSIKDIDNLGIIKSAMCKKLIYKREIEVVKIGTKNFISHYELIRYLKERTIPTENYNHNRSSA